MAILGSWIEAWGTYSSLPIFQVCAGSLQRIVLVSRLGLMHVMFIVRVLLHPPTYSKFYTLSFQARLAQRVNKPFCIGLIFVRACLCQALDRELRVYPEDFCGFSTGVLLTA